jgi:hypothetical protein
VCARLSERVCVSVRECECVYVCVCVGVSVSPTVYSCNSLPRFKMNLPQQFSPHLFLAYTRLHGVILEKTLI